MCGGETEIEESRVLVCYTCVEEEEGVGGMLFWSLVAAW